MSLREYISMNAARESFIKGGLFCWGALFLVEAILFQANGALPLSVLPTFLFFIFGGCLGLICQNLWQLNAVPATEKKPSVVENRPAYRNSYEEWKRF